MFDQSRANRAIRFIENVCGLRLARWQRDLVAKLFGTVRPDGRRQYRKAYCEVPKKNGKSKLAAAIALYCLIADGELEAKIYSAASSRQQAREVFDSAAAMVQQSDILRPLIRILDSTNIMHLRGRPNCFYRAISADGRKNDGINPHVVIADEIHQWRTKAAADLWQVVNRGQIARRQSFTFAITTAGESEADSPLAWNLHTYAENVSKGLFEDPEFYGVIYTAPEGAAWDDPATWIAANPSHEAHEGGFLRHEELERLAREALNSPANRIEFERYHLNRWQPTTAARVVDLADWDACEAELRPLAKAECYAGVDLSIRTDLTALALIFPRDDGTIDLKTYQWLPEARIRELTLSDQTPFLAWKEQGHLEAAPGERIDHRLVLDRLAWIREYCDLREVAIDPAHAHQFSILAEEQGFPIVEVPNGYKHLSEPTKDFLELIKLRQIRHEHNPLVRWTAKNLRIMNDGRDNYRPVKPDRANSPERIDPMVAAIMAHSRVILHRPEPAPDIRFI